MVVVVMGVSGCGKTTVGRLLAAELGWPFYDADDLHPEANLAAMGAGRPLDDVARQPWLDSIEGLIRKLVSNGVSASVACSALKQAYREQLTVSEEVRWVYLTGSRTLLQARLKDRTGHFMPADLLDSQLRDLEEPGPNVPRFDVTLEPSSIVAAIVEELAPQRLVEVAHD